MHARATSHSRDKGVSVLCVEDVIILSEGAHTMEEKKDNCLTKQDSQHSFKHSSCPVNVPQYMQVRAAS